MVIATCYLMDLFSLSLSLSLSLCFVNVARWHIQSNKRPNLALSGPSFFGAHSLGANHGHRRLCAVYCGVCVRE